MQSEPDNHGKKKRLLPFPVYLKELSSKEKEEHEKVDYANAQNRTIDAWDEACDDHRCMQGQEQEIGFGQQGPSAPQKGRLKREI